MKLEEIKIKASQENFDINPFIVMIYERIAHFPLGSEVTISSYLIPQIEAFCDKNEIPFYHVTRTCCTVAETYNALYEYERAR